MDNSVAGRFGLGNDDRICLSKPACGHRVSARWSWAKKSQLNWEYEEKAFAKGMEPRCRWDSTGTGKYRRNPRKGDLRGEAWDEFFQGKISACGRRTAAGHAWNSRGPKFSRALPAFFCKSKPPVLWVVLTKPARDAARHEGRDNGAVFGNVPEEIARGWDTARTGRSSSARRFQTAGIGSFGRLQPQVCRGRKTAGEDGIRCAGE